MDKVRFPSSKKVYLSLLALAVILLFILPRVGKFSYDYKKGSPWMYETLVAQFDFPVMKTEEQLAQEREALGSKIVPYYKNSPDVRSSVINSLKDLDLGEYEDLRKPLLERVDAIYSKGVVSSYDAKALGSDGVILIKKNKRAVKYPVSEVFTIDEAKSSLVRTIARSGLVANADSLALVTGISDLIVPDLIFDQQATDLIHFRSADNISLTSGVVESGSTIVSKGEIVTSEIQQILDSYKKEYENSVGYSGPVGLLWLSNALLAMLLVALLFFVILYTNADIFQDLNRFLYILLLFLLSTAAAIFIDKISASLLYMVPFTLIALYMLAFFKKRVVLPVYIISLLPLLIFCHNGVELFVMFLSAGIISVYTFGSFSRGWLQFVNALFIFLALAVVWLVFRLADGFESANYLRTLIFLFLGSIFCVAGYPLIYLFEKMFRLVSNTRLAELCDTNSNRLLQELSTKAPGTFQHSLQVMNMCDAAASAIGANVALIRAGAMYHDVGKLANPQCFIENTDGTNSGHEGLSTVESARILVNHVTDGLMIAAKYRIPPLLRSFIETHHGTTCTGYFFSRFLQEGGDVNSEEAKEFFYKGRKPSTKEQVILMLCDCNEAAARSLDNKSPEAISALVDKIIQGKITDGQLSESDLTMKELNIVRDVIKQYLQQIHHPRVAYPAPAPQPQNLGRRKRRH